MDRDAVCNRDGNAARRDMPHQVGRHRQRRPHGHHTRPQASHAKKGNDQTIPLLNGPCVIDGETVDPLALIDSMPREGGRIFPFDSATISTSFTRGVASCNIEDLRFHDLRHDGVSRLFEAGYPIEQVSMVSGHKDWNMLRRSTQLAPEALHRD